MISIPRILSNHTCASGGPPRQICPPAAGLSSTTTTFAPLCAARHAAAIPAGPAPTTSTSQLSTIPLVHKKHKKEPGSTSHFLLLLYLDVVFRFSLDLPFYIRPFVFYLCLL